MGRDSQGGSAGIQNLRGSDTFNLFSSCSRRQFSGYPAPMHENPPIRADSLRFALAFALRDVRLERHRLGLSEETRYRIAREVVDYLVRDGRWPELNQEIVLIPITPAYGPHDKRAKRNI